MSKLILFTVPFYGHMQSLVLLKELVKRGEEVACYADGVFEMDVKKTGAEYRDYGCPLLSRVGNIMDFPYRVMRSTQVLLRSELERIRREKPACLIYDPLAQWGAAIRELLGTIAVSVTSTFLFNSHVQRFLTSSEVAPLSVFGLIECYDAMARAIHVVEEIRREFGIKLDYPTGAPCPSDPLNIVYTSRLLQPFSETLDERYLFVGPVFPDLHAGTEFPWQQVSHTTIVFVSFGTVFNHDRELFETCFKGLRDLDCQVVAATAGALDAAHFPDEGQVTVRSFVPQSAILKRASATITHGGMNTVSESLYHGVPAVIIPFTEEQELVARRVAELGAGVHLSRSDASPATVRQAISQVLEDPYYRIRCALIRESFEKAGGIPEAADRIQALLRSRHSGAV